MTLAERLVADQPNLALILLRSADAYVQPSIYTVTFQFSQTTINTDVEGTLIGSAGSPIASFPAPLLVKNMVYTVQRPNADQGNILKGPSDEGTKRNPYVDLTVKFNGPTLVGSIYDIAMSATPIENICDSYGSSWTDPWALWPGQAPTLSGRNTRTLQDDEIPYIVRWTLRGKSIIAPLELCTECARTPRVKAQAACLAGFEELAEKLRD